MERGAGAETLSKRRSANSRTTRSTPRPVSSRRGVARKPRARAANRTLPVQPSVVLLAMGGLFIAWQLVIARSYPELARFLPKTASGMMGLVLVSFGMIALWMEGAGLREPSATAEAKKPARPASSNSASKPNQ